MLIMVVTERVRRQMDLLQSVQPGEQWETCLRKHQQAQFLWRSTQYRGRSKNVTEVTDRVSICKTLAQLLWNKTQNFSFFVHQFCSKKQQFANHSQKSFRAKLPFSAFAKLKFCAIPQLEFRPISQFRKTQTVGDGVCFLEFNSGKILFWNVFP